MIFLFLLYPICKLLAKVKALKKHIVTVQSIWTQVDPHATKAPSDVDPTEVYDS